MLEIKASLKLPLFAKLCAALALLGASSNGLASSDCKIPEGPIAYNIGSEFGRGEKCKARSVVVNYMGDLSEVARKGKFGMGYINPLVESDQLEYYGYDTKECFRNTDNSKYCEGKFNDYGSHKALRYLTDQILHWKDQGKEIGQSCVPVDIDNCDAIGSQNYQKVMNLVSQLNQKLPAVKVKIFVKNAHMRECQKFLNHPEAVGTFIEEITADEIESLIEKRSDPKKILLFAQGSQRERQHESLAKIAARKIPNSAVSFGDGDYVYVNQCVFTGDQKFEGSPPKILNPALVREGLR